MGDQVDTFRHLCNAELQLQHVVMQTLNICRTQKASQQLYCLQSELGIVIKVLYKPEQAANHAV